MEAGEGAFEKDKVLVTPGIGREAATRVPKGRSYAVLLDHDGEKPVRVRSVVTRLK